MSRKTIRWCMAVLTAIVILCFWLSIARLNKTRVRPKLPPDAPNPIQSDSRSPAAIAGGIPSPSYVALGPVNAQDYRQATEYILQGRVIAESGSPLPGAVVSIHTGDLSRLTLQWPPPIVSEVCNDEGLFVIRMSSPMHAFVLVRMSGYAPKQEEIDIGIPGIQARTYRLRTAVACVEGQVLDRNGVPIVGALVFASAGSVWSGIEHSLFVPNTTSTDSSGKYGIYGIPEGNVSVAAAPRRNLPEEQWIEAKKGKCEHVDFRLAPATEISLVVSDVRGEPIANAYACGRGRSDVQGEIRFPVSLETGRFDCNVSAAGFRSKTITLDAGAPSAVVILADGPILTGQVLTESGAPVEGAKIDTGSITAFTDAAGGFSVRVSSDHVSGIKISKLGFVEQQLQFSVDGSQNKIRLKTVECGIYGRVTDGIGKPIDRFRVSLRTTRESSRSGFYERDFENEQGMFSITDVPAGIYDLTISSLPHSSAGTWDLVRSDHIEIRKGYYYGEILAQLSRLN